MKELLTYIAQSLVDNPDQVVVTERLGDGETLLELRVAADDMGKVIGRQGRIAKEIRRHYRLRKAAGLSRRFFLWGAFSSPLFSLSSGEPDPPL